MSITDCDITSFPRSRSDRVSLTSNGGKCKGDDWQTFRSFPVTEFYNLESQHAKTARGTFLLLSFFVITLPKNHTNIWLGTRSYQLLPAPTSSYQLLPAPTSSYQLKLQAPRASVTSAGWANSDRKSDLFSAAQIGQIELLGSAAANGIIEFRFYWNSHLNFT